MWSPLARLWSRPQANWTYARTKQFEVYTTCGERAARQILEELQRLRHFFLTIVGKEAWSLAVKPVRVIAFRNREEFAPFQPGGSAAFHIGGNERDIIALGGWSWLTKSWLKHEYVHAVVRSAAGYAPRWLNEGFAQMFQYPIWRVLEVEIGHVRPSRRLLRQHFIDLPRFLDMQDTESNSMVYYAQAWLLTHMLFLSDDYRDGFPKLLDRLMWSRNQAFEEVYRKSLADIERDLRKHLDAKPVLAVFDYVSPPVDPPLFVGPAEPIPLELALGELLLWLRRFDEARVRLEGIAADSFPEWWALRGYLELRQDNVKQAIPCLRRAMEQGRADQSLVWASLAAKDPEDASWTEFQEQLMNRPLPGWHTWPRDECPTGDGLPARVRKPGEEDSWDPPRVRFLEGGGLKDPRTELERLEAERAARGEPPLEPTGSTPQSQPG